MCDNAKFAHHRSNGWASCPRRVIRANNFIADHGQDCKLREIDQKYFHLGSNESWNSVLRKNPANAICHRGVPMYRDDPSVLVLLPIVLFLGLSRKQICLPLEIDHFWDRKSRQDVQDQCPFVFALPLCSKCCFSFGFYFCFPLLFAFRNAKYEQRGKGGWDEEMLTDLLAICKHLPLALFTCLSTTPHRWTQLYRGFGRDLRSHLFLIN